MSYWSNKSDLEKTIVVSVFGPPQTREHERRRYLGFLRERVIEAVTFDQIATGEGIKAIEKALDDERAAELVIHGKARQNSMSLIKLARQKGIDVTITTNPKFVGNVAIIVIANTAVDVPEVMSERSE